MNNTSRCSLLAPVTPHDVVRRPGGTALNALVYCTSTLLVSMCFSIPKDNSGLGPEDALSEEASWRRCPSPGPDTGMDEVSSGAEEEASERTQLRLERSRQ